MHQILRFVARATGAALLVGFLPAAVAAHEVREVAGGQYELVVGFLEEPAFAGEQNGLDLRVSRPVAASPAAGITEEAEGSPVEGLSDTLQAEVIYGEETMELELEPRFGEPGAYRAVFFPTAEGDYTFHIFGDIEGTAIDERFTSGPETFSPVESSEPLQFPKGDGAVGDGAAAGALLAGTGGFPGGPVGPAALIVVGFGVAATVLLRRKNGDRPAPAPFGARLAAKS